MNSPLDLDAVERILKALGDQHVPETINRELLLRDLEEQLSALHGDAVVFDDLTLARRRESTLKKVKKAAETIQAIDNDVWNLLEGTRCCFGRDNPYREDPRQTMQRLLQDIEYTFHPPAGSEALVADTDGLAASGSPFTRLAGRLLPGVFKRHFPELSLTYTRTQDGETDGPYIRFAFRSLIEMQIMNPRGDPYTCSAIADALTDLRLAGSKTAK